MKIGTRTPSFKKMFKARTTGRIKRSINDALNPFYGKKGIDFINNPKRSINNRIYKKTTFSIFDLFKK